MGNFQSGQKNERNPWKEHAETKFKNHVRESRAYRAISLVPESFDFLMDEQSLFYDSLPIAYVTLDRKRIVKSANLTAAEMLGVEKNFLINTDFVNFVCKEDQALIVLCMRASPKRKWFSFFLIAH